MITFRPSAVSAVLTLVLIILTGTYAMTPAWPEPMHSPSGETSESDQLIHSAGHVLDEAWDAFHKAALGGTLASPEIQTAIEQDLMTSRSLLRQARQASHQGNPQEVRRLTGKIQEMGERIVRLSQRKKN